MLQAIGEINSHIDMYNVLFTSGPLSDAELAERMHTPSDDVVTWTRAGVEAGFLNRSESGCVSLR